MTLPQYININGTSYSADKLSAEAKQQAANIQVVDAELARLQQQIAIAQTARNAYSNALIEAVKGAKAAAKEEKAAKPAKAAAKEAKPAAKEEAPKKARAPRKAKAAE
ncbi:hypothetical protein [Pseudoduganella sp. OTU4001]|uniref:hypothetical protein n=1 Tax=Pseudoduganella sp. OTU4001 TaxID=3043854 RepID=UPI00313EEF3F